MLDLVCAYGLLTNFETGCNVVVAGTATFTSDDPAAVIADFRASVENAQLKASAL